LTNPELCYENVACAKRLIDTINYNGPICAMTDNTKLKPRLRYSPNLGCIIGSVLSKEETTVNVYNDIPKIINNVKSENGIAKNVHMYILQICTVYLFLKSFYNNILIICKFYIRYYYWHFH
jgi:hypothetical protein